MGRAEKPQQFGHNPGRVCDFLSKPIRGPRRLRRLSRISRNHSSSIDTPMNENLLHKKTIRMVATLVVLGSLSIAALAQARSESVDAAGHQWWQNGVFYEIYPRSFADSNNDGVGDLNGITSKLDYLKDLGVDAIWITPCFPSPQVDFGYDVSDYLNIDPMYGTLADFDKLASEAQEAQHPYHSRFRGESHLRSASVVPGFEIVAHIDAPRLVHLARWQGSRPASQQLGLCLRRVRMEVRSNYKSVLLPLLFIRSSPT